MRFDHTAKADLLDMAEAIANLPLGKLARLNAFVISEGLMGCSLLNRLTVRVAAWLKRQSIHDEWLFVYLMSSEINVAAGKDLMRHIVEGKDRFDPDSAGGFSGPELARIEGMLDRLGYRWHMAEAA